mgnify:FL=1
MKLPEPDTHCYDDDTQKDVWSYSKELVEQVLSERDAVLRQALDALYWTTPIGGKPVKQTQDAMDAIRKAWE